MKFLSGSSLAVTPVLKVCIWDFPRECHSLQNKKGRNTKHKQTTAGKGKEQIFLQQRMKLLFPTSDVTLLTVTEMQNACLDRLVITFFGNFTSLKKGRTEMHPNEQGNRAFHKFLWKRKRISTLSFHFARNTHTKNPVLRWIAATTEAHSRCQGLSVM